jgi:uncharacterized protein
MSYFVLPLVGPVLLFLLVGKNSRFVRFHSAQAFNIQITCTIIQIIGIVFVTFLSWLGSPVSEIFWMVPVIFGVVAMVSVIMGAGQSLQGKMNPCPKWMALRLMR